MNKIILAVLVFSMLSCSSENKYDTSGFKHGKWTEYLIIADTNNPNNCYFNNYNLIETHSDDSIKNQNYLIKREVVYDHGYPKGIVKDYGTDTEKKPFVLNEFHLISGPYSKYLPRPYDIYTGLYKWIIYDQLVDWNYFDKNGNEDVFKKISTGINDINIKNDSRLLPIEYYKDSLNLESFDLFDKYKNKESLLKQNIEYAKKIIQNKNIWNKEKGECPWYEERSVYEILIFDMKNKDFISNIMKKSTKIKKTKNIPLCKWCGNPNYRYTSIGSSEWEYCSDKCWNELRASKGIF